LEEARLAVTSRMGRELPRASLLEGIRFTAQVAVPNLVQGLFRRRRRAVAVATRGDVDGHAIGFVAGLRRRYRPGPLWVRVAREEALLLLEPEDVRRVLEGSPDPFAADPETKRRGMSHFQPHALTISRGGMWEDRRRFTEAVLDTGEPLHRLADTVAAAMREEVAALLAQVQRTERGELRWSEFHHALGRITRRVILGDSARDDEETSELLAKLMDEANGLPQDRSEDLDDLMARLRGYASEAEAGSLVSLFAEAPSSPRTKAEGQIPHWMFAMHDTLAANAFRALALIVTHPRQRHVVEAELGEIGKGGVGAAEIARMTYLEACLQEAMRLWPTTALLSRETVAETDWEGETVPAGTQVLIHNTSNHRDPDRHDFADRFSPEEWTQGTAAEDWSFSHFSHGPQGCPGAGLALFVGKAMLANLLASRRISLLQPDLDPERPLPRMLDFFGLRFAVERRA
jgi:cytochrome P450